MLSRDLREVGVVPTESEIQCLREVVFSILFIRITNGLYKSYFLAGISGSSDPINLGWAQECAFLISS